MGRSRSRSPSPTVRRRRDKDRSDRKKRRRSRERERERAELSHRGRHRSRDREFERSRSRDRERSNRRSRSRSRSRSHHRSYRYGSPSSRTLRSDRPQITEADLEGKTAEEIDMMKTMGFCNFDTTKNKKVDGNEVGDVHVILKRKYRQYMNRKGGFNRPLDFVA